MIKNRVDAYRMGWQILSWWFFVVTGSANTGGGNWNQISKPKAHNLYYVNLCL